MTFELYDEVLITQRPWKEIINILENKIKEEKMFRAGSHRWSELPKGKQWAKGGKENRVSNTWVLGFSYKPRNHPAGAVSMDIASPSQRCAVGKEKSGQEGMYRNSFMQLLVSVCIHQSHIQMTLTISHAGVNCYLAGIENRILSCKASICWKSKCQLTKYLDGEISHPLPILPPLWKVMGVGDNWRRNEIMRVHQEKIKCWWHQSWWVCCGHYLLMRLPRRLPLKSWWLWEQAFLHQ